MRLQTGREVFPTPASTALPSQSGCQESKTELRRSSATPACWEGPVGTEFLPLGSGKATPASESTTGDQRAWTTQRIKGEQQCETFSSICAHLHSRKISLGLIPLPIPLHSS